MPPEIEKARATDARSMGWRRRLRMIGDWSRWSRSARTTLRSAASRPTVVHVSLPDGATSQSRLVKIVGAIDRKA